MPYTKKPFTDRNLMFKVINKIIASMWKMLFQLHWKLIITTSQHLDNILQHPPPTTSQIENFATIVNSITAYMFEGRGSIFALNLTEFIFTFFCPRSGSSITYAKSPLLTDSKLLPKLSATFWKIVVLPTPNCPHKQTLKSFHLLFISIFYSIHLAE